MADVSSVCDGEQPRRWRGLWASKILTICNLLRNKTRDIEATASVISWVSDVGKAHSCLVLIVWKRPRRWMASMRWALIADALPVLNTMTSVRPQAHPPKTNLIFPMVLDHIYG